MLSIITAAHAAPPCAGSSAGTLLFAGGSAGIPVADFAQARCLAGVSPAQMKTSPSYGQIAGGTIFVPRRINPQRINPQRINPQLSQTTRISPDFKGGVGPQPGREPV